MGKGAVDIKTRNSFVKSISNVFYIPDLKANLFSIDQLQEKEYVIVDFWQLGGKRRRKKLAEGKFLRRKNNGK